MSEPDNYVVNSPFACELYQCVYCDGPAERALFMNFRGETDNDKPSIVIAYWMCAICMQLEWNNPKPLKILQRDLADL